MTYKINILPNAEDDLTWFRKNSKNDYLKCFDKEVYSRRVNHKDRMVYTIFENQNVIDISSFKGHY